MKISSGYWAGLEVMMLDAQKVALHCLSALAVLLFALSVHLSTAQRAILHAAEYPSGDVTPTPDRASKHVQCMNDQRFSLRIVVPRCLPAVEVRVSVDGREIDRFGMPSSRRISTISSYNEYAAGGVQSRWLKFGVPGETRAPPTSRPAFEKLGTIVLSFRAGTISATGADKQCFATKQSNVGPKAGKLLGSLVVSQNRGDANKRPRASFKPETTIPPLNATFVYRTKAALLALGIKTAGQVPPAPSAEVKPKRKRAAGGAPAVFQGRGGGRKRPKNAEVTLD